MTSYTSTDIQGTSRAADNILHIFVVVHQTWPDSQQLHCNQSTSNKEVTSKFLSTDTTAAAAGATSSSLSKSLQHQPTITFYVKQQ